MSRVLEFFLISRDIASILKNLLKSATLNKKNYCKITEQIVTISEETLIGKVWKREEFCI